MPTCTRCIFPISFLNIHYLSQDSNLNQPNSIRTTIKSCNKWMKRLLYPAVVFSSHSTPHTKTFLCVATWGGGTFLPAEPKVTQNCLKWIDPVSEIFPVWGRGAFLPAKPKVTRNCLKCFSAQFFVIIIFIIDSYYSDLSYSKSITKSFAM